MMNPEQGFEDPLHHPKGPGAPEVGARASGGSDTADVPATLVVPGIHMTDEDTLADFGVRADRRITSIVPTDATYRASYVGNVFARTTNRMRLCTIRTEDPNDPPGEDWDRPLLRANGSFDSTRFTNLFADFWDVCAQYADVIIGGNEVGLLTGPGYVSPDYYQQWVKQTMLMHDMVADRNRTIGLGFCSLPNFGSFHKQMWPENTMQLAIVTRNIVALTRYAATIFPLRQYVLCLHLGFSGDIDAALAALVAVLDGTNIAAVFPEFRYPVDDPTFDASAVDYFWSRIQATTWRDASGVQRGISAACYAPAEISPSASDAYNKKSLLDSTHARTVYGHWYAGVNDEFNSLYNGPDRPPLIR